MNTQEQVQRDEPHEYGSVKCDLCAWEWVAVRPVGLERLECPNCGNMVMFDIIDN